MATFVLIPGAGTDPRAYEATIAELAALGHEALAPPLPLDDEAATPSDHAAAVAEATPSRPDVVVVAQSLGAFTGPRGRRDGLPMLSRPAELARRLDELWSEGIGLAGAPRSVEHDPH